MGKIKVKMLKSIYENLQEISFSLVSSPKNNREQIFRFVRCKAKVHDVVTSYVKQEDECEWGLYTFGKNPDIDMNKLRLLVNIYPDLKDGLFSAKKILNVIEKAAGWKPSKIVTIDAEKVVCLITGPKQWMKAPSMLSMVTLILRVCTLNYNIGLTDLANKSDIEEAFKCLADGGGIDGSYLRSCWDKIFLIVENYDKLFEGISTSDCYKYSGHYDGIQYLCHCKSECDELNKRMEKLIEKNNIPIPESVYFY